MDYWNRFDDAVVIKQEEHDEKVRAENKTKEVSEYKQLLKTLAVAFTAAVIGTRLMQYIVGFFLKEMGLVFEFTQLHVISFNHFTELVSPQGYKVLTIESLFTVKWLVSDIIVYTPYLIIFPFAFRKYMDFKAERGRYDFPSWSVYALFAAGYGLGWLGTQITQWLSNLLQDLFGTKELVERVFENMLPTSQDQSQWLLMYIFVGITGPVIEEVIFRHYLLKPLRRFGDLQAIIFTAVLFGIFHGNYTQLIYTMLAGLILGIAAVRGNSVYPAIGVHIMNNCFSTAYSHFFEMSRYGKIPLTPQAVNMIYMLVIYGGLLLTLWLLVSNYLSAKNENPHIPTKERARILIVNPWIVGMVAVCVAVLFFGVLQF
jgi:membrane protease YdiL (CAAX protease family)